MKTQRIFSLVLAAGVLATLIILPSCKKDSDSSGTSGNTSVRIKEHRHRIQGLMRYINKYYYTNNLISSRLKYDSTGYLESRDTNIYEFGKIRYMNTYHHLGKSAGSWFLSSSTTITHTGSYVSEIVEQHFDDNGTEMYAGKTYFFYTGSRITEQDFFIRNSGVWVPAYTVVYSYNPDGSLSQVINTPAGSSSPWYKITFTWNGTLLEETDGFSYESLSMTWIATWKDVYEYVNNRLTKETDYEYDAGNWSMIYLDTYEYNASGILTKHTYTSYTSGTPYVTLDEYTYESGTGNNRELETIGVPAGYTTIFPVPPKALVSMHLQALKQSVIKE